MPIAFGTDNNWQGGFTVEQNLFQGPALVGVSTATIFRTVQAENYRATAQNVVTQARQAYYRVLIRQEIARLQAAQIGRLEENLLQNKSEIFDELSYENSSPIIDQIIQDFADEKYDHVEIIYNSFKNAANQIIKSEQLLPIVNDSESEALQNYIFEPSMEQIVSELVPKSLRIQLFKALRDSFASEHGARMTAMHKATDNATELKDELVLTYNKARQAAITNEILEIVSGAEALKG